MQAPDEPTGRNSLVSDLNTVTQVVSPAPTPSLSRRLSITLLAVLVIDLVVVSLVAAVFAPLIETAAQIISNTLVPVPDLLVYGIVVAGLLAAFVYVQLRTVRGATLSSVDLTRADEDTYTDLRDRVARLAQVVDTTPPAVGVIDSEVANCFSVGGSEPIIVVSDGLLDQLDEDELDAVLAHELAHLLNRDATVMALASFLPTLISDEPIGGLPKWARSNLLGGLLIVLAIVAVGQTTPTSLLAFVATVAISIAIGGVLLGVLATPVVYLSHRLSHDREFVADEASARISGKPGALASALRKLDDDIESTPTTDLRSTGQLVSELCLLPHGFVRDGDTDLIDTEDGFTIELQSHPSTARRIERLQQIAADFER